ncbi:translation initiation factor IF-2 [Myotis myotis]|uniref:translation initiation factor IF-2 n=1 Tax=Myotis myotis TaxID=51298 RepID=UPI001748D275|nr:translation initiation factor IF-2 [Myotis myotis]
MAQRVPAGSALPCSSRGASAPRLLRRGNRSGGGGLGLGTRVRAPASRPVGPTGVEPIYSVALPLISCSLARHACEGAESEKPDEPHCPTAGPWLEAWKPANRPRRPGQSRDQHWRSGPFRAGNVICWLIDVFTWPLFPSRLSARLCRAAPPAPGSRPLGGHSRVPALSPPGTAPVSRPPLCPLQARPQCPGPRSVPSRHGPSVQAPALSPPGTGPSVQAPTLPPPGMGPVSRPPLCPLQAGTRLASASDTGKASLGVISTSRQRGPLATAPLAPAQVRSGPWAAGRRWLSGTWGGCGPRRGCCNKCFFVRSLCFCFEFFPEVPAEPSQHTWGQVGAFLAISAGGAGGALAAPPEITKTFACIRPARCSAVV